MWVFVCGMQRSGSTLQYQMVARLLKETGTGKAITWVPESEFDEIAETYDDQGILLLYKCHEATPCIRRLFQSGRAVGLYTYRDPRDSMASWQRKTGSSFEQLWVRGPIEKSIGNYRIFTQFESTLVSRYEDFTSDLHSATRDIARHLGVYTPEVVCDGIAEDLRIGNQIERAKAVASDQERAIVFGNQLIDKETLLHADHITSDGKSTWRAFYSPIEQALLAERLGDWIAELGYENTLVKLGLMDKLRLFRRRRLLEKRRSEALRAVCSLVT